jgi:hypothetical protein
MCRLALSSKQPGEPIANTEVRSSRLALFASGGFGLLDQAMMLRHPKSIRHSLLRQLVSDWDHLSASFGV